MAFFALGISNAAFSQSTIVEIPSGPATEVINRLGIRARVQIMFPAEFVAGCRVKGFATSAGLLHALDRVAGQCGLRRRMLPDRTILLEKRVSASPASAAPESLAVRALPGDEIIVTALKRPTVLGATAISMSVKSGDELETAARDGMRSLTRQIPELGGLDTGTGQQRLTVRGVFGTGEPTVAVYYDETSVVGPVGPAQDPGIGAPDLELVDIDRVELLRGPQGTLYGASSMGGTLRVLFNHPDLENPSGDVRVGVTSLAHGQTSGFATAVVNVPLISGKMALRAVAYRHESPAYIYDSASSRKEGGRIARSGGRLSAAFRPSTDLSITGLLTYQRLHAVNGNGWYEAAGRYINDQRVVTPYDSEMLLGNGTARLNLTGSSLVVTLSRYRWRQQRNLDYSNVLAAQRTSAAGCRRYLDLDTDTECSQAELAGYTDYVDTRLPATLYQPMTVAATGGEVRFVSTGQRQLDWTLGLFAQRRRDVVDSYALLSDVVGGKPIAPLDITGHRHISSSLGEFASFGELSWHLSGTLTATAGGRYFVYRRSTVGTVPIPNVISGTGELAGAVRNSKEHGSSAKFALAWHPGADFLVYIQASQGFRPGGVNITPGLSAAAQRYSSDRLWSYELGLKSQVGAELELSLQAALYHIDWSDMIAAVTTANNAFSYNANIGAVDIDGAELEVALAPWRNAGAQFAIVVTNGRLARDQIVASANGVGRRGDRLPNVAPLTMTASLSQRLDLKNLGVLRVEGDVLYSDGFASQLNRAIAFYERTPSQLTATVAISLARGPWSASLRIDNVTDALALTRILTDATGRRRFYSNGPRSVTLTIGRQF